jgi:hypothetical protein
LICFGSFKGDINTISSFEGDINTIDSLRETLTIR